MNRRKIAVISGDIISQSDNKFNVKAIAELPGDTFQINFFNTMLKLPCFNYSMEEIVPQKISELKYMLMEADGIIVCSAEHIFSLPILLKSEIDWRQLSHTFLNKPTAFVTITGLSRISMDDFKLTIKLIELKYKECIVDKRAIDQATFGTSIIKILNTHEKGIHYSNNTIN